MFHEEPLIKKQEKVTASLSLILNTDYVCLLNCSKSDAQKILDALQTLLDTSSFRDRKKLIAAIYRLSQVTGLYPTQLLIKDPPETLEGKPVAAGGFAKVYKVVFQGHDMCFKTNIRSTEPNPDHVVEVHAKEAILWAQLSHPNILPFHGLTRISSRLVFVSPWAANGNVVEYLADNPHADRSRLCLDTAAGMEYLHENDIVHGDLKGYNVVIDSFGRAVLCDFGLSGMIDFPILWPEIQSAMASKGGTKRWMAPELISEEDNSKESDVFAWACVCYEIFTGQVPYYKILNPTSVALGILLGKTPTRPEDSDAAWHKCGLTQQMWDLMEECWAFHAKDRESASAIVARLKENAKPDMRKPGEWKGEHATRYRREVDVGDVEDVGFWEDLDSLLAHLVSGLKIGATT